MKEVLELIEQKKQEFAKLPFFEYLRDEKIDPRQRLVWAPCITPLVMAAKDLNLSVFREKQANEPIQKLINFHTHEDGRHWKWFLSDLEKLELDPSLRFTDTLRFLWGEETQKARLLAYSLVAGTFTADVTVRLVAIEAIEATANVAFSAFAEVGEELQKITNKRHIYFSKPHLDVENGHIYADIENVEIILQDIQLTDKQNAQALDLVDKVFEAFTQMINHLMIYAQNNSIKKNLIPEYFPENQTALPVA